MGDKTCGKEGLHFESNYPGNQWHKNWCTPTFTRSTIEIQWPSWLGTGPLIPLTGWMEKEDWHCCQPPSSLVHSITDWLLHSFNSPFTAIDSLDWGDPSSFLSLSDILVPEYWPPEPVFFLHSLPIFCVLLPFFTRWCTRSISMYSCPPSFIGPALFAAYSQWSTGFVRLPASNFFFYCAPL